MERRDFAPLTRGNPLPTEKHGDQPLLDYSIVTPHPTSAPMQMGGHKMRSDRNPQFFSSDDSGLTKQIVATHAPDFDELDVRPVLDIVEQILHLARPTSVAETALVRCLGI